MRALKALEGRGNPCLNCPPIEATLPLDARVAVGFGYAAIEFEGDALWMEDNGDDWADCPTVAEVEAMAAEVPEADWRIVLDGPLHGETYQRQGPGTWVLVKKNEGFA